MHSPLRTSIPALFTIPLAAIAFCIMPIGSSHAAASDIKPDTRPDIVRTPAEATADFYANISARNLGGVMRYVPAEGFTEVGIGTEETHRIDEHSFEAFFKSELAINLHAVNLSFQEFGDTAIVTGIRAGSITPKGAQVADKRDFFTMVWIKNNGKWLLRHVHLSSIDPAHSNN